MKYICVLRFGISEGAYEYVFSKVKRENGAINECDNMITETVENMREHAGIGGRVIVGGHPTDPRATVVACMKATGQTIYKTVTYREKDGLHRSG